MADFDTHLETITGVRTTVAAFNAPAISLFYRKKRAEGNDHLTIILCSGFIFLLFIAGFKILLMNFLRLVKNSVTKLKPKRIKVRKS